jgi:parvulin-like peptidyl-prolyl isomerase
MILKLRENRRPAETAECHYPRKSRVMSAVVPAMMILIALTTGTRLQAKQVVISGPRTALVIIDEDTIFTSGVDSLLVKIHRQMGAEQRDDFDYRKLLDKLINDRLIIQEAKRLGMEQDSGLLARLEEQRGRNAIRQYVADRFKPDLTVPDDTLRAYYAANFVEVQIRTMALRDKAQAEQAVASIRAGVTMDSLARVSSLDTYRYRGGLHNPKPLIDVEEPSRAYLATMKPGDLSPIFPYKDAYTFFRLEQRLPADTAEFSRHQRDIESLFQARKKDAAWKTFMQGMKSEYPVTIDSAVLARIAADSAALFTPMFVNDASAVVMQVDDRHALSEGKLRSAVSRQAMTSGDDRFERTVDKTLRTAEEELILGAAADAGGIRDHPEVSARYADSRDSALIDAYLKETVVAAITFNRAEFETYYAEHEDEFREPTQVKVDRIATADSAAAFEAARRLADGADYAYIAGQYTANIGDGAAQEWAPVASFPDDIKNDLDTLTIGRSTRPYNTSDGWLILHVADRRQGKVRPLAEVEMKIREVMFRRKFAEGLDRVLAVLKKNATIVRNEAEIERYFGSNK